jgi:two-component system response regulator GlrR
MTGDDFARDLAAHHWPGNVRELRNHVERCVATGAHLRPPVPAPAPIDDHGPAIDLGIPMRTARDALVGSFERRYLEASLRHHGNNITAAARTAGIDRLTFYRLLWRYGLR